MKTIKNIFNKIIRSCALLTVPCSLCFAPLAQSNAASRAPAPAGRGGAVARAPSAPVMAVPAPEPEPAAPEPAATAAPSTPAAPIVSTSFFDEIIGGGAGGTTALAEEMKRQRDAMMNSANMAGQQNVRSKYSGGTGNPCDAELRKCMQGKCGDDFTNCQKDSETIWGDKIESCGRAASNCSGREITLFAPEIRADREQAVLMSGFERVIQCGFFYNSCIIQACSEKTCGSDDRVKQGQCDMGKCLTKAEGDAAMAKCKDVADKCRESDSGLTPRVMEFLAALRTDTEKSILEWEQELYAMRDALRDKCVSEYGTFDDRSLSCVFSVEFRAAGFEKAASTRTLAAGSEYMCTPEWFGVDITTYLENAARHDRESRGATSAMLGAGLGIAAGTIASGAQGRAADVRKAEAALEEEKCNQANLTKSSGKDDFEKLSSACKKKWCKEYYKGNGKEEDNNIKSVCQGFLSKVGGGLDSVGGGIANVVAGKKGDDEDKRSGGLFGEGGVASKVGGGIKDAAGKVKDKVSGGGVTSTPDTQTPTNNLQDTKAIQTAPVSTIQVPNTPGANTLHARPPSK